MSFSKDHELETRNRIRLRGITQGVGFRPFVWKLAERFGLSGWVQNDSSGVLLEIQGTQSNVAECLAHLRASPPPLARVDSMDVTELTPIASPGGFAIRTSSEQPGGSNPVAQDISICADCYHELTSPDNRRYRYPFINCTNCGPRFTIVEDLPYDRPATTMKSFKMCDRCQREYDDPGDRRFHAQPNACPQCGPVVWLATGDQPSNAFRSPNAQTDQGADAIDAFASAVGGGQIIAAKGIGGFHLVCDATNPKAVELLRDRKGRVDKPFAVMVQSVNQASQFAQVTADEKRLLESKERPIVLLRKKHDSRHKALLRSVAPGNDFVGVMLPYSPLHHLLIVAASPLVMTSGNLSDEPIVRTNEEARVRLADLADCFLLHNRDIHAVCDDSVVRVVNARLLPIRRSRGYAPMPIKLREAGPSVVAVGGEMKATFCVTRDNYAYMSQHIGDVGNLETLDALQRNVEHFRKLFRIDIEAVAGDLHPDYLGSQWARQLAATLGVPFIPVQHHYAHAMSLLADQQRDVHQPMIAACFDGTGYGTDQAIWGGEFLMTDEKDHQRFAQLSYFPLPGGDASIKRPYRTALSLLSRYGMEWDERLPSVSACSAAERRILQKQIEGQIHCTKTSSIGRLFDAIASLIGIRHQATYEAQAAMELEATALEAIDQADPGAYAFDLSGEESIEIGCQSLLDSIRCDLIGGVAKPVIAAQFHHAIAGMIFSVCHAGRRKTGVDTVGLTGGVFQNVLLSKLTEQRLAESDFQVLAHSRVPPNDGGLALGQAVVARQLLLAGGTKVGLQ